MWINESEMSSYLKDVKKHKVLSPDEESELILEVNAGVPKAEEKLIYANLRFVISVAKEYQNRGLDFKDLVSEGNYGLVKAAKRFNSTIGVRFYSYAVWWIRQAMMQALNEHARTVRLPVNVINDMNKNQKSMSEKEYGDWCVYHGVNHIQSLNTQFDSDGSEMISNLYGGENDAFSKPFNDEFGLPTALEQVLTILNSREKEIIKQYYGLDGNNLTLQQIANDLNLTKERVRQIKNQAIKKLRFNAPSLFKFFDD